MRVIPLIVFALFVMFLVPQALALNVYDHYFYNYQTGNPQTIITPSFRTTETNCTVYLSSLANSTAGAPYSITTEYYSPDDNIIGISERPLALNATCVPHGSTFTTTANNSMWEAKAISTLTGGYSHTNVLTSRIQCGTNQDYLNISTSQYDTDSNDNAPNVYFQQTCNAASPPAYNYFLDSADDCGGVLDSLTTGSAYYCCGVACVSTNEPTGYWVMPFTTGASGIIDYEYANNGIFTAGEEYGYYEISDPSGTYIQLTSASGRLYLTDETDYGFYVHGKTNTGTVPNIAINISINVYTPAWDCGEWSACEYGQQFQTCSDPLGKVPNRIEYRGCIETTLFDVLLGFEKGYIPGISDRPFMCGKAWFAYCYDQHYRLDEIEYPLNWNVINPGNNYFLRMDSEYYTVGGRSLKMWVIPPGLVYDSGLGYCNWSNKNIIPQIIKPTNESLFVEANISFPSPFMTIDYDIKRCPDPEVKFDGWCGKECYGYTGNCSGDDLKGNYYNALIDSSTFEIVYQFYDIAPESWETRHIDISEAGIQVGSTYNLVYAVLPEHEHDPYGYCIYIDNVRISVRSAELDCEENYCVGVDLYKTRLINESVCVFEIEYTSPSCLPLELQAAAEAKEDVCVEDTLYTYNNQTDQWESIPNATICLDQLEETTIYDPLGVVEPLRAIVEPMGLGFIVFFFAPIFIALIIAIIGAFYVVNELAFDKQGSGIVFLITFLAILGVESLIGLFPIWFVIMLIVISGLGTAIMLNRT